MTGFRQTVLTRIFFFVGEDALPKDERRAVANANHNHVRKPEGAVRRGRHGVRRKNSGPIAYRVTSPGVGIAEGWEATALEAEVRVETVPEGGRRFMAAWRKYEVDAARHRQEKRESTRLGKLLSYTAAQNPRSDTNWLSRRTEGIL